MIIVMRYSILVRLVILPTKAFQYLYSIKYLLPYLVAASRLNFYTLVLLLSLEEKWYDCS